MTAFSRGDVVLVEFVFSDVSGTKLRPALVVSTAAYHRARQEVIVAAITSNVTRRLVGDYVIADWQHSGLLFPSNVTGIIRTIKRSMIRRKLGSLADHDLDAVNRVLPRSLGLQIPPITPSPHHPITLVSPPFSAYERPILPKVAHSAWLTVSL